MSALAVVSKSLRVLQWGSLIVDQDRRIVSVAGAELPTSPAEFRLIELLITHRNLPLSKHAILEALFAPGHGRDPRQIDMFVARLRRTFNAAGIGDVISTIAGRGYAVLSGPGQFGTSNARPHTDAMLMVA